MIMNADCKGALAQLNKSWRAFVHRGNKMTKAEVKAVLQYAVQKGYPHTGMLTDEEVDNILQQIKNNHKMNNTCPACKSTNTKDASIRENNGIYGPGAASWVVEEKSICNDCGIYFKPMGNEPTIVQGEEKKYPIGGYAPGNYYCTCSTCNEKFQGDKRSFQCEPCGTKSQDEWDALTPEQQDERIRKNMEIWNEFQNQQKQKDGTK